HGGGRWCFHTGLPSTSGPRTASSIANDLYAARTCGGQRADELSNAAGTSTGAPRSGQTLQGRKTSRPAGAATDAVLPHHQPQGPRALGLTIRLELLVRATKSSNSEHARLAGTAAHRAQSRFRPRAASPSRLAWSGHQAG